jgi:uncharacterized damage-inducible protein DinB
LHTEDFRLLYDYNGWANHRVLNASAALSEEQFTRDLGSSFPSVRDTLVHIFGVEWLWLERWHGRSHDAIPPASDFPNHEAVGRRWTEIERNLLDYVASLTPDDIQRVVEHQTTRGVSQAQPLWQMLQHVVNHGTYHRGQVTSMLRQLGAHAEATDLILFYRQRTRRAGA